jgi:hypothetical protein
MRVRGFYRHLNRKFESIPESSWRKSFATANPPHRRMDCLLRIYNYSRGSLASEAHFRLFLAAVEGNWDGNYK